MSDNLKDQLEGMIAAMDVSRASFGNTIAAAAVEAALLDQAAVFIGKAQQARENFAKQVQAYTAPLALTAAAAPAEVEYYPEPVDHLDEVLDDIGLSPIARRFSPAALHRDAPPEVRHDEAPFATPARPGPVQEFEPVTPGNAFYRGLAVRQVA